MADPKEIPWETKWKIASRLAAALPVMYDFAFRETVGEKYDELERDIWIEVGKEANLVAGALRLPVRSAADIAATLQTIAAIFFGPEWTRDISSGSDDRATLVTKRCPFVEKGDQIGQYRERNFQKCLAFSMTAVGSLNKNYTVRFIRSMCMGDKHCEMKIVPGESPGEPGTERK
jgi:hypothetical protein